jgi:hypothetical protein
MGIVHLGIIVDFDAYNFDIDHLALKVHSLLLVLVA